MPHSYLFLQPTFPVFTGSDKASPLRKWSKSEIQTSFYALHSLHLNCFQLPSHLLDCEVCKFKDWIFFSVSLVCSLHLAHDLYTVTGELNQSGGFLISDVKLCTLREHYSVPLSWLSEDSVLSLWPDFISSQELILMLQESLYHH